MSETHEKTNGECSGNRASPPAPELDQLAPVIEGASVPLRRAAAVKQPDGCTHRLAFVRQKLADGHWEDHEFEAFVGFNGLIQVVFDEDHDNGDFIVDLKDIIAAAVKVYEGVH